MKKRNFGERRRRFRKRKNTSVETEGQSRPDETSIGCYVTSDGM